MWIKIWMDKWKCELKCDCECKYQRFMKSSKKQCHKITSFSTLPSYKCECKCEYQYQCVM